MVSPDERRESPPTRSLLRDAKRLAAGGLRSDNRLPVWRERVQGSMDTEQQKRVVRRFLEQCNAYADGKLADYANRLAGSDPAAADAIRQKIVRWESYKAFNAHALDELATDRLDDWFDDPSGTRPPENGTQVI
jgi:hypothetical protein